MFPNGKETMTDIPILGTDPSTIAEHDANGAFSNSGELTFGNGDISNEARIRDNRTSGGYPGASGSANIQFQAGGGDRGFSIEGIDASIFSNLSLQFAVRKMDASGVDFAELAVEYWNGSSWNLLSFTYPTITDDQGWYLLPSENLPADAQIENLAIRWVKSGDKQVRVDDIELQGTANTPANLVVTSVNDGISPEVNTAFFVDLEVQDASGQPANVNVNTDIELIVGSGSGSLMGTLTGTIIQGTRTLTISGVSYNVSEVGVVITAQRTSGDNLASGDSDPINIIDVEPTLSTFNFAVDGRSQTTVDLSWLNGDGSQRIVVAKEGGAVDQVPVDGTTYVANSDFEMGEDIGNGNIVVFNSNGSNTTITNLQPNNTEYFFAVYEYNGAAPGLENYKQLNPATGNTVTTCNAPITQSSNIEFSNITTNTMRVTWTVGDGDGQVVVLNSSNNFTTPTSPPDPADPSWKDSGQQVVFIGDGTVTSVDVTGLNSFTDYWVRVYEYNCTGLDIVYNEEDNATSQQTRLFSEDFSSCPPADWSNITISGSNSWQCANGYISVTGVGSSSPSEAWYITPAIDLTVLSNEKLSFDTWTSGTDDTHPKLEVLVSTDYSGVGNPSIATWTAILFNTPNEDSQEWINSGLVDISGFNGVDSYIAFRYKSSGVTNGSASEWRVDNVAISDQSCSSPQVDATNLQFPTIDQNEMGIIWTTGDGIGRIVVAGTQSITFVPTNGSVYTANPDFTQGAEVAPGQKIIFSGNSSNVLFTGLDVATEYFFTVYEYNCEGSSRFYKTDTPLSGSQTTLDPDASDIIAESSYVYNQNIDYVPYFETSGLDESNSIDVFRMEMRDEGDPGVGGISDSQPTELTSITFSTNGSTSLAAAAIFEGSKKIAETLIDGSTSFTFDNFIQTLEAPSDGTIQFTLRVTFLDDILDNEQLVFTVTEAISNPIKSPFKDQQAGGAESISGSGDENRVDVMATELTFITAPTFSVEVNEEFRVIVEAIDSRGSRDLDKSLTIAKVSGSGNLLTSSFTKSTANGRARWTDLTYDAQDAFQFSISDDDGIVPDLLSEIIKSKVRYTIYTFTGNTGAETAAPPDFQPVNAIVSDITRQTVLPDTRNNTFTANNWPSSTTVDLNSYFEFSISATVGNELNITSIEFDHRRRSNGPSSYEVRNSTDGFTTFSGGTISNTDWNRDVEIALSISGESTVTFRIYGFNASNSSRAWSVDNIEIFGQLSDVQPPSFTAGFPVTDSARVDGFHLQASVDEPVTAYYQIWATGDTGPVFC